MNMLKKYLLILLMGLCANILCAELPVYTCDFEDPVERSKWTLNAGRMRLLNIWCFGAAGDFSEHGEQGLFISADLNQVDPIYDGTNTMFVTAVRNMSDVPAGNYRLYFDWKCKGKRSGDGFYVCWVPDSVTTNSAANTGGLPKWVQDHKCDTIFSQENLWTVGHVDINHTGVPSKLVILWYSTQGVAAPPSACIDNLELRPITESMCAAPYNISHEMQGDTVILKWKGTPRYYDVRCYDHLADKWVVYNKILGESINLVNHTCSIPGLSEGVQTFIIRAHCGDDMASDFVSYTKFIFHKGVRCIDYMDLEGNCYTGSYTTRAKNQRPFSTREQVDLGYDNPASRHTLHYVPDEYDELTNYQLRTCPEGYLASVRLGNSDTGNGTGESIEYKYKVQDGASAILKIKYALVLSNPHPESPEANPQFWLDILSDNKVIPNECGFAMFTAGDSENSGWIEGASGVYGTDWMYKEWTEHSINLSDYVGKTLTIRLVTTDCQPSAHTGYVYFVLDCEDGGLSGLNCGEDNPTTDFEAPSGFDYVWYLADNPLDTLDRDQHFQIAPLDTNVYCVNVINKNNADCWYTLTAVGKPRVPTPMATYSTRVERCQNIVTFENQSCVYLQNMVTDKFDRTNEPVTYVSWDFGDGSVEESATSIGAQVQHMYPPEGGTFIVKLTAGISNNACVVTDSFAVILPDLSTPITEVREDVCKVDYPFGYPYAGVWLYEDVDSVFTLTSKNTGCDSLCHLVLKFHDIIEYSYCDTICEGDTLHFFKQALTKSGQYADTIVGASGCDSIVQLNLHVEPMLQVDIQDSLSICLDNKVIEIPYQILNGNMDSIIVVFDSLAMENGLLSRYAFGASELPTIALPDSVTPNFYSAVISYTNPYCDIKSDTISLELLYSSSIAQVKTDLLAVQNDEYNGGYAFDSIQWYRAGEPITGAITPNLAVSAEDIGVEFTVKLRRDGEDVMIGTCPIVYLPTSIDPVYVPNMTWPLHVYNVLGMPLGKMTLNEFTNLPAGIYLLSDEKNTIKVIL